MATITKTPAGTWKAVIRRRGWPVQIKTFRLKRDAEDWGRRTEDEMIRGVYITRASAERMTVAAALQRYMVEVTPTKRESTQKGEGVKARRLIASLGNYSLAAVTPEIVAAYRDERMGEVKANTVRLELALLGHMYTVAIKEWGMGGLINPVGQIRKPSPGPGRNRRLDADEQARLLVECRKHSNPKLAWIVEIAIETGMRAGEIESLRRGQVDLNRRIIRLEMTKNGSARTVPMTKRAAEVMREVLDDVRPIDTDLLFWGELSHKDKTTGKRTRKAYQWRRAWVEALQRAGITGLRFHDLRHEAVSRLVESGLGDQQVAAISGHKSMQMLRRYTHLRAEDLVAVLDQIGDRARVKK